MKILKQLVNADLLKLRSLFQARGFDIRLVGGCVRDMLAGVVPKDIDLCTDATPEEQQAIYSDAGLTHIGTGVDHGTYTVVMSDVPYEITTLRFDAETDGRHAVVRFTRDWVEDLARRDLTINAMSMTFDGELVDPFNGQNDLRSGTVRFVGDANERMREDYLRILRFFRFLGRFGTKEDGGAHHIDQDTASALWANVNGLTGISAERVWAEVKKILAHDSGPFIYYHMCVYDINSFAHLPDLEGSMFATMKRVHQQTRNPVTVISTLLVDEPHVEAVASLLKWSTDERKLAKAIVKYREREEKDLEFAVYVDGESQHLIAEVMRYQGKPLAANYMVLSPVPTFPMTGADLIGAGHKPGKEMGVMLRKLKVLWFNSGCRMTKGELWGHYGS